MEKLSSEFNALYQSYHFEKNRRRRFDFKIQIVQLANVTLARSLPKIVGTGNLYVFRTKLGFDLEDIRQECLIILLRTLDHFQYSRGKSFYNFFFFNIRRRIYQLFKRSNRKKRIILITQTDLFSENSTDDEELGIDLLLDKIALEKGPFLNRLNPKLYSELKDCKDFVISKYPSRQRRVLSQFFDIESGPYTLTSLALKHRFSKVHVRKLVDQTRNQILTCSK